MGHPPSPLALREGGDSSLRSDVFLYEPLNLRRISLATDLCYILRD